MKVYCISEGSSIFIGLILSVSLQLQFIDEISTFRVLNFFTLIHAKKRKKS